MKALQMRHQGWQRIFNLATFHPTPDSVYSVYHHQQDLLHNSWPHVLSLGDCMIVPYTCILRHYHSIHPRSKAASLCRGCPCYSPSAIASDEEQAAPRGRYKGRTLYSALVQRTFVAEMDLAYYSVPRVRVNNTPPASTLNSAS